MEDNDEARLLCDAMRCFTGKALSAAWVPHRQSKTFFLFLQPRTHSLLSLLLAIVICEFVVLRRYSCRFFGSRNQTVIFDEMAELIGIVGSAFSVAQLVSQIASSVMKLKSYLNQMKDAPEEIISLAEQIEGVQIWLEEMECDQTGQQALFLGTNPVLRSLDLANGHWNG
jgi:hypothetical protein